MPQLKKLPDFYFEKKFWRKGFKFIAGVDEKLTKEYPLYGWGRNKGYGTKLQQKAILRYGLTRYHRRKFVVSWRGKKANISSKNLKTSCL